MTELDGDLAAAVAKYVAANDDVRAFIGTASVVRMFPDVMPEGVDYPAVAYSTISGNPEYTLTSEADCASERVQFDCYALSKAESRRLARKVRAAISGRQFRQDDVYVRSCHQGNIFTSESTVPDGAGRSYYITSIDFNCWFKEAN